MQAQRPCRSPSPDSSPKQSGCALIDAQALSAANLADADANAGLAKAESLITSAKAGGCRMAQVSAEAARGDNLLTLGRYRDARDAYEHLIRTLTPAGPGVLLAGVLRRAGAAYYVQGQVNSLSTMAVALVGLGRLAMYAGKQAGKNRVVVWETQDLAAGA